MIGPLVYWRDYAVNNTLGGNCTGTGVLVHRLLHCEESRVVCRSDDSCATPDCS